MRLLAPSILSADFLHLAEDIESVNTLGDIIHLDVMDGALVPNISFGFPVIEAIAKIARKPLDIHLMIENPWNYFERFAAAAGKEGLVSFHLEAAKKAGKNPSELLQQLKSLGVKAGIVINPDIPVEELFPYIDDADYMLIMSVFAGFGGQSFIPGSLSRISALKAEIQKKGDTCLIEVDGGVDAGNADDLAESGVDIFVAGSSFFKAGDRKALSDAIKGRN